MQKGISFTIVMILTPVAWVILGYLLRLFFPSISLLVFLIIGLISGLLLATLLTIMHEDTVVAPDQGPAEHTDSDSPPLVIRPGVPKSGSGPYPQA